jgi:pyruvate kinase
MEFKVIGIEDNDVICRVIRGGRLTERRGVATPGKAPSQEFPDDKAKECLAFAVECEADFVALSTVTSSDDIKKARRILLEKGMKTPFIISKVERAEAIENIAEIVDESDALMVARGDMGVEVPLKRVPIIQKDLIRRSNRAGKPVITATQMLESMVSSSSPTRAEVTDVANAVYDGTDAVMLSGETSIGDFPVESVQFMADVAREAEKTLPHESSTQNTWRPLEAKTDDAISFAACQVANQIDAGMIVAFTESGISAGRVSRYRPRAKILALTPNKEIQRMLSLRWGVFSVIVDGVSDVEEFFLVGEHESKKILGNGSYAQVVLVAGTPIGVPGSTNLLRVLELGEFD